MHESTRGRSREREGEGEREPIPSSEPVWVLIPEHKVTARGEIKRHAAD